MCWGCPIFGQMSDVPHAYLKNKMKKEVPAQLKKNLKSDIIK